MNRRIAQRQDAFLQFLQLIAVILILIIINTGNTLIPDISDINQRRLFQMAYAIFDFQSCDTLLQIFQIKTMGSNRIRTVSLSGIHPYL